MGRKLYGRGGSLMELNTAKRTVRGVSSIIKGTGTETPKTVKYYDIEAANWRSFKIENLITIY